MTLEQFHPAEPSMLTPATDSWAMVLADVAELSRLIADTDFVPTSLRGNVGKVAAAILHGRELGLPPMTSLSQTAVINGRPTISAEAMRGLILQAGHELVFDEQTSSRCVVRGRRAGSDNWTKVEWTSADAERAGLARRDTYRAYPRQMLAARATAELARLIFPDALHGMKAAEEAEDFSSDGSPAQVGAAPDQAPRRPVRRSKPQAALTPPGEPETRQKPTQAQPEPATPEPAAEPAVRQRPTIKPRGTTKPSEPEPDPEPEPTEKLPNRFYRTVEPDTPAEPEDVPLPFTPPGRATQAQTTAIVMHLERLGQTDRDQRIETTTNLVGRLITSTNDLDEEEAAKLIDQLAHLRNKAALDKAIKETP